ARGDLRAGEEAGAARGVAVEPRPAGVGPAARAHAARARGRQRHAGGGPAGRGGGGEAGAPRGPGGRGPAGRAGRPGAAGLMSDVPEDVPLPGEEDPAARPEPTYDVARAERAVRELLLALGEDPDRDGLRDTPAR